MRGAVWQPVVCFRSDIRTPFWWLDVDLRDSKMAQMRVFFVTVETFSSTIRSRKTSVSVPYSEKLKLNACCKMEARDRNITVGSGFYFFNSLWNRCFVLNSSWFTQYHLCNENHVQILCRNVYKQVPSIQAYMWWNRLPWEHYVNEICENDNKCKPLSDSISYSEKLKE